MRVDDELDEELCAAAPLGFGFDLGLADDDNGAIAWSTSDGCRLSSFLFLLDMDAVDEMVDVTSIVSTLVVGTIGDEIAAESVGGGWRCWMLTVDRRDEDDRMERGVKVAAADADDNAVG